MSADVEDWMGASVWRVGRTAEGRLMWRTGWGQVSGEWTNSRRSPDVDDWMGASVWRVGRTAEGQLMWRTGWGQVSGEWDEQQKVA